MYGAQSVCAWAHRGGTLSVCVVAQQQVVAIAGQAVCYAVANPPRPCAQAARTELKVMLSHMRNMQHK